MTFHKLISRASSDLLLLTFVFSFDVSTSLICNSSESKWKTPMVLSNRLFLHLRPVTIEVCLCQKSMFEWVCPSAAQLSRQMVPTTLIPKVDDACKLSKMILPASIPLYSTLSAVDTFLILFDPLISYTYFAVAFLLFLSSTRNSDDALTEIKAENVLD